MPTDTPLTPDARRALDYPGLNPIAAEAMTSAAVRACPNFTPSQHKNAHPTGPLSWCVQCQQPQWRHWLREALAALRSAPAEPPATPAGTLHSTNCALHFDEGAACSCGAASRRSAPQGEPSDLGLSLDMLDADRLRLWADRFEEYGSNITEWGSRTFIIEQLRRIATGIDTSVRDIGTLRAQEPTGEPPTCGTDWKQRFERSQQRWGNLKVRIKSEIAALDSPHLKPQQRSQYANGIARLNWVLDEMRKSPDVLAEAVPAPPSSQPAPQEKP